MSERNATCIHESLLGQCGVCTLRGFPSENWKEGWALGQYSSSSGAHQTEIGRLLYVAKYYTRKSDAQEKQKIASDKLSIKVYEFLKLLYDINNLPFDAVIYPPRNKVLESGHSQFNNLQNIAEKFESVGIRNYSDRLVKIEDFNSQANVPKSEREKNIKGKLGIDGQFSIAVKKGFLVFDDILDTGATANEVYRTLERYFPEVPRYYLALAYLSY